MALDSKVIYIRKSNGASIKAYVVDYFLDTATDKKYVIIVNTEGKSAKGFELIDGDAFILSAEEAKLISNYKKDDTFRVLTDIYEDGLSFDLKKRQSMLKPITDISVSSIASVIKDENDPKQKRVLPDTTSVGDNVNDGASDTSDEKLTSSEETETLTQAGENTISEEVQGTKPEEENEDNINISVYQGTIDNDELGKRIIFYVYDQTVVKKYQGYVTLIENDEITISDLKAVDKINVPLDFDVNKYIGGDNFEPGACFVEFENYIPSVKMIDGKPVLSACMSQFLRKPEAKRIDNLDIDETNIQGDKIIVFNGDSDLYENKMHYSIWGSICTVVSKEPLTVIPEKNGIKTIIYEEPTATSIEETCQSYQNLYPALPVYLLHEKKLVGSREYVLEENDYTAFSVNEIAKTESLLTQGRRILTESEMIARREAELEALRKNNSKKKR